MKKLLGNKYIDLICRLVVGAIFIYSSASKIYDPCDFAKAINGYKILPPMLINLQAAVLPGMELCCAIFIIQGRYAKGSSLLIVGMLLMFISAISFNLIRGVEFECGCFGSGKDVCDSVSALIVQKGNVFFSKIRGICDVTRDFLILIPAVFILVYDQKKRINIGLFAMLLKRISR